MSENKPQKLNNKNQTPKSGDVKLSRVFYHYWKFAKKYKWWFILITFLSSVGNGLFMIGTPYLSRILINTLNDGGSWEQIRLIFIGIVSLFI